MAMNMNHSLYRRRRLANLWGIVTSMLAMTLGLTVLLWVLFVITFMVLALAKIMISRAEKAKGF